MYRILATVNSNIKHRAFADKPTTDVSKQTSAEITSFRVVAISEGIGQSTEENKLRRKVNNIIILMFAHLGTQLQANFQ